MDNMTRDAEKAVLEHRLAPFAIGSICREDCMTASDDYGLELTDEEIDGLTDEQMQAIADSLGEEIITGSRFVGLLVDELRDVFGLNDEEEEEA